MKRLFVFVPATLLGVFLLNSFVLKEKEATEKTPEEIKYFTGMKLREKLLIDSFKTEPVVFKSVDGGQTWQDISQGLPEKVHAGGFFTDESGLYFRTGKGVYHNSPNSTSSQWEKEIFPDKQIVSASKTGIFAYNQDGQFLQKINGTNKWVPKYTNLSGREVETVFETAGGTILISAGKGLLKSSDGGKTWKSITLGGWVRKFTESNGILLATSERGILRSTDDGETWLEVINEGVGIDVERIKGGFAAITYNSLLKSRRIKASYDGGRNWHLIDAGLPKQDLILSPWEAKDNKFPMEAFVTSIVQVGENLFCAHGNGIFKSSDKGKTWKLLLPSGDKVLTLSVSGNVIYAMSGNTGC